ncbi:DNA polymerase III subunit delta [Candidatus Falkowbacteria bacterium]|nr:DNA polymerase III subunit delta [Candidatus Falkowbacteria bacterium]
MIILLSGPDSYRISQKLNKYKQKFLRDVDSTGVNIETLDGKEVTIESFRKAVLSGGLFVKKRLIIIRELFSNCKDKSILDGVGEYVKKNQDNPDIVLIFLQTETHKSQNSKLFKDLSKQKFSEKFTPLEGIKLTNWLKKEIETRNGKISSQALSYLSIHLGADLWQLSNEINKLVAYRDGQQIETEDVKKFVKTKLDENIFNLTDALGRKDKAQALKLISDQINSGSAWPYLLTMLARQIKILLQIKSITNEGETPASRLQSLGLHPFVVQKSLPQANNFTLSELKKLHHLLVRIDLNLKTTSINPEVLFDLLVSKI